MRFAVFAFAFLALGIGALAQNSTTTNSTFTDEAIVVIGKSSNANFVTGNGDAFSAFQQALAYMKMTGGGIIKVENGEYVISQFISLQNNTRFIGNGSDKTVIKLATGSSPSLRKSGMINAIGMSNIEISGITLDSNGVSSRDGIYIAGCSAIQMTDIKVKSFQRYGFSVQSKNTLKSKNIIFNKLESHSSGVDGFQFDNVENIRLKELKSTSSGRHGFSLLGNVSDFNMEMSSSEKDGWTYYNGTMTVNVDSGNTTTTTTIIKSNVNEGGCGVFVQNKLDEISQRIRIASTTIDTAKRCGFDASRVNNLMLTDNKVSNTPLCMKLASINGATISGNTCDTPRGIMRDVLSTNIVDNSNQFMNSTEQYIPGPNIDEPMDVGDIIIPSPSPIASTSNSDTIKMFASSLFGVLTIALMVLV